MLPTRVLSEHKLEDLARHRRPVTHRADTVLLCCELKTIARLTCDFSSFLRRPLLTTAVSWRLLLNTAKQVSWLGLRQVFSHPVCKKLLDLFRLQAAFDSQAACQS